MMISSMMILFHDPKSPMNGQTRNETKIVRKSIAVLRHPGEISLGRELPTWALQRPSDGALDTA